VSGPARSRKASRVPHHPHRLIREVNKRELFCQKSE
jgi:hypothetical protein